MLRDRKYLYIADIEWELGGSEARFAIRIRGSERSHFSKASIDARDVDFSVVLVTTL